MAYADFGDFNPGEWCRFCRANGVCKAQADKQITAFDDFQNAGEMVTADALTPEQISSALEKGKNLTAWYESLQKVALEKLLNGTKIPGYKVVEGRSSRVWSDQDKALETLEANGVDHAIIYDSVPKTLSQLEKLLGKAKFAELVGNFVLKPQGKPTLVPETDKRNEFNSAINDFSNTVQQSATPKYSVTLLIPKTDTAVKANIDASIEAAAKDAQGKLWNGVRPPVMPIPIHDGDGVRENGTRYGEECKGNWVITASSKNKPQVVYQRDILTELLPQDIYSGMYARVTINFFGYSRAGITGKALPF